jgi:REP element-mobilizing transposase RayT
VKPFNARGHLSRLTPEFYRGFAMVHWTMTVHDRRTGWLTEQFHARCREALVHTLVRYGLLCPAYCLMPDHAHFVCVGIEDTSDQKLAVEFFRRQTNASLAPHCWQREAYDHVLREEERTRGAFSAGCSYVLDNPARKGLAQNRDEYPFSGAMLPGYPDVDPRREDFWDVFWKIYNAKVSGRAKSAP